MSNYLERLSRIPSLMRASSSCLLPIDWEPTDKTLGDFTKVNDRWICAFDESDNSLRKRFLKQESKITEYYIDILNKYVSAEEAQILSEEAAPYEKEYLKMR